MTWSHLCTPADHRVSRRAVLGAAGCLGLGSLLRPAAAAELEKKHKQVLFIWIDGGMSQLESWDPKPNTVFGGPFRAIPTSVPGIHVSELLPRSAKIMQHLAILRSLHTQDNSHSAGVARIQRGDPKNRGVAAQRPDARSLIASGCVPRRCHHGPRRARRWQARPNRARFADGPGRSVGLT